MNRDDQVKQLVSIDDVLPVVENMFFHEGRGEVTVVPRERIQAGPNYLAYMGGANNYQEKMGILNGGVSGGAFSKHSRDCLKFSLCIQEILFPFPNHRFF